MAAPAHAPKAPSRRKRKGLAVVPPPAPIEGSKEYVLDHMDPEYLECRDLGHQWARGGAYLVEEGRQIEQVFRCRCGTHRFRRLDLRGGILYSHYDYPDGFLMPKGMGLMSQDDRAYVRLRLVQMVPGSP
jgi:hypothetical protein